MTRYDVLQQPRATHRGTPALLIFRMTDSPGVRTDDGGVLIVIAVYALLQIAYVHTGSMQVVFDSTHPTFEEWIKVVPAEPSSSRSPKWRKRSFAASAEAPLIAHPSGNDRSVRPCKERSLKHEDNHRSNRLL